MKPDFWNSWKRKTKQELLYITKIRIARKMIIDAIPKKQLVSIYIKGSFARRELKKGSDIDIVPIVKENKYQGAVFGVNCPEISPAMVVPLSISELKKNKLWTKAGYNPDLRAEPDRFLKKLNNYGLIYGSTLNPNRFPVRSDKKALKDEINKIKNGYIPAYRKGKIGFDPLLKEVFWLVELEQSIKRITPKHSFKGIANSVKDKDHIIHGAYKLKKNPTKNKRKILQFIKKLEKHLIKLRRLTI